jgi:hypothetical protein
MAKSSRPTFEEVVAGQERGESVGADKMRTLEGIIRSILDLNRDEMIGVLEHEERHAEAAARAYASGAARARQATQKDKLLAREAEMSSREASVRRILFYLRHGIPAHDETAEEKTLRDLLTERLRPTGQWPQL